MSVKVSVVMCCYNAEQHLKKAIDSILSQTFKDFEFIIWNDGSNDNTESIIKSYDDKRILYYYHENTGLGQALRMACEKAQAPIIARMDADDVALPNRLSIEYDYLSKNEDVALVSSAVYYIDDSDTILGRSFPYTKHRKLRNLLLKGQNAIVHPSSMFRKNIYEKAGGYLNLKKAQDLVLFSRMSNYGKIVNYPFPLIYYRISTNSISTQTQSSAYDEIIRSFLKKMSTDINIDSADVTLYNDIILRAKNRSAEEFKKVNRYRYRKSLEEILYNLFKYFLGKKISTLLVVKIKGLLI